MSLLNNRAFKGPLTSVPKLITYLGRDLSLPPPSLLWQPSYADTQQETLPRQHAESDYFLYLNGAAERLFPLQERESCKRVRVARNCWMSVGSSRSLCLRRKSVIRVEDCRLVMFFICNKNYVNDYVFSDLWRKRSISRHSVLRENWRWSGHPNRFSD